ncbi:MAG: hypothetical protein ACR2HQ_04265 [Ilumatobacteraceae bacterium]
MSAAITFVAFYPGHANGDTANAYLAALDRIITDDWVPTTNVLIFRAAFAVWRSPASVLLLQCLLMWGGLAGMTYAVNRALSTRSARYFIPLGFLPFVFPYVGALVKDSLSATLFVAATALLMIERVLNRRRAWLMIGALGLFWVAFLVKISVLPAVLPIVVYISLRLCPHRGRRGAWLIAVCSSVGGLFALTISQSAVDDLVASEDANIQHALEIFDLAGITHYSGENVLGDVIVPPSQFAAITTGNCYDSRGWDSLAFGPCNFVRMNALPIWHTDQLTRQWRDAILAHPAGYLRHRLTHFASFSLNPGTNQFYGDYVDARLDWTPRQNVIMDFYGEVVELSGQWPHTRPILWETASAAILVFLIRRPRRRRVGRFDAVLITLMVGNILFYGAWFVVGAASEYRYSFTVIVSCLVATAVMIVEWRSRSVAAARISGQVEGSSDPPAEIGRDPT